MSIRFKGEAVCEHCKATAEVTFIGQRVTVNRGYAYIPSVIQLTHVQHDVEAVWIYADNRVFCSQACKLKQLTAEKVGP